MPARDEWREVGVLEQHGSIVVRHVEHRFDAVVGELAAQLAEPGRFVLDDRIEEIART